MKRKFPIRLGVNIDHAATLRQVRGGITEYPNLLDLVKECKIAGASQITVHLREDRRHIQDQDVIDLCQKASLPINLEMAASSEMYEIAKDNKPDWICLVPEKRKELTTEGGLDVVRLKKQIQRLQQELLFSHRTRAQKGIEFNSREQGLEKGSKGGSQKSLMAGLGRQSAPKMSCFIAPELKQVSASLEVGAAAVEFHTGHWVHSQGQSKQNEWRRLKAAAVFAHKLGLRVHAGHGLDFDHAKKIRELPYLIEVNIGHSLICYALEMGLRKAVFKMRACLK